MTMQDGSTIGISLRPWVLIYVHQGLSKHPVGFPGCM